MIPADRQRRIQELIERNRIVRVTELAAEFGVTELTVRRDLDALAEQGLLDRTHGGAILRRRMRIEPFYAEKHKQNQEEKRRIARAVNSCIDDGDTLMVNTGSTTTAVLRGLSGRNLRVVTSNAAAVAEVDYREIELILTGGVFRPQSNSLVGPFARSVLSHIVAGKAIIGVDGLSISHGLTTPAAEEAEVTRLMIERTEGPIIVVADHSKMGVVSNFVTVPVTTVHTLITDAGIAAEFRRELEHRGIRVMIAEGHQES
jgi:DeoR/GlpR family transcriptional regulator of sugar metabolism